MTPDETSPQTVDERLLAQMMACDALLHLDPSPKPGDRHASATPSAAEADDRARSRLLLLLRMLDAAEAPMDSTGAEPTDRPTDGPGEGPTLLGRFEILEDLGAGGFGFVVRARDRLLGREVALKMPLPERVLGSDDVRRFLREAQAAARLDHPHIVRVFDAGELGPLGYFIAAEFCAGPSLRRWLKARNAPVPHRTAAAWAAALADAAQHAHDRGILHRDIKPDNVILARVQGPEGFIPRLTDFGLAKVLEQAGDETRSGARMGTPHYMSPEQAAGRHRDVGPATDVYALGATLYEILIGRPPFRGETEAQTLRLVLDSEPVPPRSLRPGLPRDLETICLKCLRKEPSRRYGSAADLRDDLRRFLEGRPIVGRPVSARERAWRSARRRPAVAALLATVVLLACGLVGGFAWWASWLEWHGRQLEIQVARADREAREAEKQTRIAEERRRLSDRHHYAESLRLARRALGTRQIELAQDILHDLQPGPGSDDPRGFAWHYLWRQAHREFSQLWGHEAAVTDRAISPDGRRLATRDILGKVLIWDLAPAMDLDRPRTILSLPHAENRLLAFSPNGRVVAILEQERSSAALGLFDPATGERVNRLDCGEISGFWGIGFDAESRRLAARVDRRDGRRLVLAWDLGGRDRDARTWALRDGMDSCEVSASGWFIAAARPGHARFLDTWTGEPRSELEGPGLVVGTPSSTSADGKVFAAHATTNRLALWDTGSGRELAACEVQGGTCRIALSPRGSRLARLSDQGELSVFDRSTGRLQVLIAGSRRSIRGHSLAFSSDETLLAIFVDMAPGGPQPVEVWDVAAARRIHVFPGRQIPGDVAFIPGSRSVILTGGTTPRVWHPDRPVEPEALEGHAAEAWASAFSPDGKVLATGSDDTREPRTIRLWDPATGRSLGGWKGHTATVVALAFSPDGRMLASGSLDSGEPGHVNVIIWDASSPHQRLATLEGHTGRVRSVAFSPDGKTLATASDDLTGRLWDVSGRRTRAILSGHSRNVTCITFSPDGKTVATASNDATVRTWDAATGRALATLHDVGNVLAVAFAPDGSMLASTNEDGGIKLWGPSTGALMRTIRGAADQLRCLAFTPDGRNVVAAGKGKVIRVWDVVTGQELLSLEGHQAQINALAFSPDGSTLASCSHEGSVRLWRAGPIRPGPER